MLVRLLALLLFCLVVDPAAGVCAGTTSKSRLHYDLAVKLDPAAHRMKVQGVVTVPRALVKRHELKFKISSAAGRIRWSSLGPQVHLKASSSAVGSNSSASNPSRRGGKVIWTLRGDWPKRGAIRLRFAYELTAPEPQGFLYVGPEVSFGAGGWYPELGETRGTAAISLNAPRGWVLATSGHATGASNFASNVPSLLVFAASPPDSPHVEISPKLAFTPLRARSTDAGWHSGLNGVQRALEAEFGSLPFPHISVIEVPDSIGEKAGFGAFAAPGVVLARSLYIDQPFNAPAFAHEFSHLWWGNHVGLEGTEGDFLLDEGLAQYGSIIAADRVLGTAAGEAYRRRGIPGFNESLYSALGYLKINAAGMDRPLLQLGDDGLSYWIAYSKAGLVWYALAEHMGRAQFSAALKDVIRDHGADYVGWDEFVAALQKHAPRPLDAFIGDWFETTGAPSYALNWQMDAGGNVRGMITTSDARKMATLEIEARTPNRRSTETRVDVPASGTSFRLPTGGRAQNVALDPSYKVLRWTPELREEAVAMAPYMRASILARLDRKDEAEASLRDWLKQDPHSNAFDRLILSHALLARLGKDRECSKCAADEISEALQVQPSRPAELVPTYIALAQLARKLGLGGLATRAAQLAISGDTLIGNANGAAAKLSGP